MKRANGERTRARILDVTVGALAQFGTVSVSAIAEAAGVSKAGLFHHFPTKAALIEAASRPLVVPLYVAIESCLARGERSGLQLVEDVALLIFSACREREHLARFLMRYRDAGEPAHLLRLGSLVTSALDAGVRDGLLFAVDRRTRARQVLALVLAPFLFCDGVVGVPPSWPSTAEALRRLFSDDVIPPPSDRVAARYSEPAGFSPIVPKGRQ